MRVEIINKEELLNMVKNHGEFACVCYGTCCNDGTRPVIFKIERIEIDK